MNRSKSFLRLAQLIGVAMFAYIVANLDLHVIVDRLKQIQMQWLAVYVLFFAISLICKSLRWNVVLKVQKANLSNLRVLSIAMVSSFIGLVTPGRIGEVSKIGYLREENLSFAKAAVSVVLDRLYDLAILCLLGFVGLVYFSSFFFPDLTTIVFTAALLAAGISAVFLIRRRLWDLLKMLTQKMISPGSYESLAEGWGAFKNEMSAVAVAAAPGMLWYTVAAYIFYFGQIYALALGFGIEVPFVYLALCVALSSLLALLPISVGGLGTREATFIALLGRISIPPESAVLISFSDGVVLGLTLAAIFALAASLYLKTR